MTSLAKCINRHGDILSDTEKNLFRSQVKEYVNAGDTAVDAVEDIIDNIESELEGVMAQIEKTVPEDVDVKASLGIKEKRAADKLAADIRAKHHRDISSYLKKLHGEASTKKGRMVIAKDPKEAFEKFILNRHFGGRDPNKIVPEKEAEKILKRKEKKTGEKWNKDSEEFKNLVEEIQTKKEKDVVSFKKKMEKPGDTPAGATMGITRRGFWDEEADIVYLITSEIPNVLEAQKTWAHEQIGHRGIKKFLNKFFIDDDLFFDDVTKLFEKTDEYKSVVKLYAPETFWMNQMERDKTFAEELMARRAENLDLKTKKSLYQKIKDYINKWMERLFGEGKTFLSTEEDVTELLEAAKHYVMQGEIRSWLEFKHDHNYYKEVLHNVLNLNPKMLTWYTNHQTAIERLFGEDADFFNVLVGITSPATDVESNVIYAIKTYLYMHDKEEAVGGVYHPNVLAKVEAIQRGDWETFKYGTYKVPEFTRALIGDEDATALDRHMKRIFFGTPLLNPTRTGPDEQSKKALEGAEATWLKGEVTSARHEIFRLAKEMTDETDRIWTPREVQAGLWIDMVAKNRGLDLPTIDYDVMSILNKPNQGMLGGLTPLEYLKEKMEGEPIGNLHKKHNLPPEAEVSALEEQYRIYLEKNGEKHSLYAPIGDDTIRVINYSKTEGRKEIDPAFMGRGQVGAERSEFKDFAKKELYPEFRYKSSWYVPRDDKRIEAHRFGRNKVVYSGEVKLKDLWQATEEDPKKPTDAELVERGYKGWYNPYLGQVRMFEKVRVQRLGRTWVPSSDFNKVTGSNFHRYIPGLERKKFLKFQLAPKKVKYQTTAWHGSPHAHNRFDTDKIGTGEGATAFGWGLYFTEIDKIAKSYADTDRAYKVDGKPVREWYDNHPLREASKDFYSAAKHFKITAEEASEWLRTAPEPLELRVASAIDNYGGNAFYMLKSRNDNKAVDKYIEMLRAGRITIDRNLYKVTIHKGKDPKEYTWLDWYEDVPENTMDKIMAHIKKLKASGVRAPIDVMEHVEDYEITYRGMPGHYLYYGLTKAFGQDKMMASLFLLDAGIDGIRYPTGTLTRANFKETGNNYVVFDDRAVTIEDHIKFQTQKPSMKSITLDDLRSLPFIKNGLVMQHTDGSFSVSFPNKRGFWVKEIESITEDEISFKASYGREKPEPGQAISASFSEEDNTVRIVKGVGDRWSVTHEFYHFLESGGYITPRESQMIGRQSRSWLPNVGKDYSLEEKNARWLTYELENRELKRQSPAGKMIQKISDIFDAFINLFLPTTRKIVREIESGRVMERAPEKKAAEPAIKFQTTEEKEVDWRKEFFGKKDIGNVEKAVGWLKDLRDNWQTRIFDRFRPIKLLLGQTAYMLHRLETGISGAMAAFMRHGIPVWDGKAMTINTRKKGFLEWYRKLGEDGPNLLYWIAAKRAEQLETEDREKWLTDDVRKKMLEDIGPKPALHASWDELHQQFNEFNNGILDLAEKSGLISPDKRKQWEQHFYVPFYRILENEEAKDEYLRGPAQSWRHVSAKIKRLKGAEEKLGDPLENIIRNWTHLVQESMRNVSRTEAFNAAKTLGTGVIEEVSKSELTRILGSRTQTRWAVKKEGAERASALFDTKEEAEDYIGGRPGYELTERQTQVTLFGQMDDWKIMSFQDGGNRVYFRVNDPELFSAMSGVDNERFNNFIMKMFRWSKKWLTFGATFGPAFRVANMLRDTLHTAVISKSFYPFIDSFRGFVKAMREDQDYVRFAASAAAFGSSYVRADDAKVLSDFIKRTTRREGEGVAGRILDTPRKLLNMWEKIGSASENAARVALYSRDIQKGKSHLEAAFGGRDLLDFTMKGSAPVVQFLIQMVPFMNARMQGLYKLGRAAHGDPVSFAMKGGAITLASLLLWMYNRDDDKWKELEDWDKWTYYHFWIGDKHYRIPKPFEVGAIFSSAFESAAETIAGDEDFEFFLNFVKQTFMDTFAMNPLPQLIRPTLEQWANKSFFTGRPIEPQRLQGVKPGERKDAWTSETMQLAGKFGIPPKRAEALISGYFSTFGMMILNLTDIVAHHFGDFAAEPSKRIDQYPMVGRFIREARGTRNTKYTTRFYKSMRELDQLVGTINFYKNNGDYGKAAKLMSANRRLLIYKKRLTKMRRNLSDINKRIRRIYIMDMPPEEKRKLLDNLAKVRNNITRRAYKMIQIGRGK